MLHPAYGDSIRDASWSRRADRHLPSASITAPIACVPWWSTSPMAAKWPPTSMIIPAARRASSSIPRTRTRRGRTRPTISGLLSLRSVARCRRPLPIPDFAPSASWASASIRPVRRPFPSIATAGRWPCCPNSPTNWPRRPGYGRTTRATPRRPRSRRRRRRSATSISTSAAASIAASGTGRRSCIASGRRPRSFRPPTPGWNWPTSFRPSSRAISIPTRSPAGYVRRGTRRCITRPGADCPAPSSSAASIPTWPLLRDHYAARALTFRQEGRLAHGGSRGARSVCRRAWPWPWGPSMPTWAR